MLVKRFITIKLLGFNDSDRSKLESLMTLAENMLDIPWHLTETMDADYYLLKGNLKSQMSHDQLLKTLPPEQCIFYSEQKSDSPYHEILVDKNSTPYLRSIIELFKKLSLKTLSPAHAGVIAEAIVPEVSTQEIGKTTQTIHQEAAISDYFDPEQDWLGVLLNKQTGIQEYTLNNAGYVCKLYVDSDSKCYYCNDDLEKLERFFTEASIPNPTIISADRLHSVISEQNLKPLSLNNLLWYGAFVSSKGRLFKEHRAGDNVHLKRWPDVSLPGARKLIKLAAFMQSNAVDLSTIHQQTGIPVDQINNFFNACKVIGLIEYSQKTEVHEKNLDDGQRQLFAKIGKRLKQAETN